MKAYLDYNIFVGIEDGENAIDNLVEKVDKNITAFPFSAGHIQETDNIFAHSEEERNNLINKRLSTIRQITNCLYIYQEHPTNKIYWQTEDPATVLETIHQNPTAKPSMQMLANLIPSEQREQARKAIGIDVKELNNYDHKQVVEHLNMKLGGFGPQLNLLQILDKAISFHPDKKNFGQHNYISGLLELLDVLGYWKDKMTETSNYARLWDSNHIHFASYCDYFISDDRRLRQKAKVIYDIYNIKTRIFSSDGIEL